MVARKVDLQSTVTNADFRPAVKVVKERTAKGVQIGTLWCPFQLQKFDKVSKVVKDIGQGQMSEKKQQDKSLVQVQNDCHKTVFQQHPFVGVKQVALCDILTLVLQVIRIKWRMFLGLRHSKLKLSASLIEESPRRQGETFIFLT